MGVDLAKYEDYTVIIVLDVTEEPFKMVYFNRFNKMDWQYVVDKIKEYVLTHSKITEAEYEKMQKTEWYMTAEDMLHYKLVDEIL